jgi:hypothetical protein
VTGGAGDQGLQELGRLREREEEFEGNSRGCLPWWEKDDKLVIGGEQGRVALGGGGAPVQRLRREAAQGVQRSLAGS